MVFETGTLMGKSNGIRVDAQPGDNNEFNIIYILLFIC